MSGENATVIWGTTVNIQEAMSAFRNFLRGFTMEFKIERLREMDVDGGEYDFSADDLVVRERVATERDREPFYPGVLEQ
ncbi:hypothetical protein HDU67_009745, partial [Dinochytrium kinnereticum]